jgi:hypothetical protein
VNRINQENNMSSYLFIGKPGSGKTEQFKKNIIPDLSRDNFAVFVYDKKEEYNKTENLNVLRGDESYKITDIIDSVKDTEPLSAIILDNYSSLSENNKKSISEKMLKVKNSSNTYIWIVIQSFSQIDIPLSSFDYISDFGVLDPDEKEIIREFYDTYYRPNFSYIGGTK